MVSNFRISSTKNREEVYVFEFMLVSVNASDADRLVSYKL